MVEKKREKKCIVTFQYSICDTQDGLSEFLKVAIEYLFLINPNVRSFTNKRRDLNRLTFLRKLQILSEIHEAAILKILKIYVTYHVFFKRY